ncbi:MAG: aldehyde dehydrogenase (NADP(+)) [Rhodanobacter sp.]
MTLQPLLINGNWQPASEPVGQFRAEDPCSGEPIGPWFPISSAADVEAALSAAVTAATPLAEAAPEAIADFLERYALAIEHDASALCDIAHAETGLPAATRLAKVELPRTCNQLRLAAQAVRQFSWTHPVIDTAAGLRSHFAPLNKPVLIFGPNNFPFAFNAISGSDFASAIAARNPVLAKAHPSHPATCEHLAQLAQQALHDSGLPAATVQLLYHFENNLGLALAGDARLGAIGFTGSRSGGMALKAAADRAGVPAYMEMSSVNPVFLLPGALAERGAALAQEFFASCTMGSGQFCTNPGIVVVPTGAAGDEFVATATALFAASAPHVVFSRAVLGHIQHGVTTLRKAGAACLAGGVSAGPGHRHQATLLSVDAQPFLDDPHTLQSEVFGPVSLVVRADEKTDLAALAASFEGNLTGTFYRATDGSDDAVLALLARVLRPRVGRLIINRMPTGVAVSAAMNHGGPYPSTGHPGFTAVGMPAAIHRFAALHCYDHVPDSLLPVELRDHNPNDIARLIDGQWRTGDLVSAQEK